MKLAGCLNGTKTSYMLKDQGKLVFSCHDHFNMLQDLKTDTSNTSHVSVAYALLPQYTVPCGNIENAVHTCILETIQNPTTLNKLLLLEAFVFRYLSVFQVLFRIPPFICPEFVLM